jgi:ATP-grasp domain, R2K clade family 2
VVRLVNWRLPDEPKLISEPVLYLEALMAEEIAIQLGVCLLDTPSNWLPNIPQEYRKRWIYLTILGEAKQNQKTAFIKPPNDKSFPARVYTATDLPTDYPDEMLVLVAEIVRWEKEFRCFILNRCLKTFSIYLRNGELQSENDFAHTEKEDFEVRTFVEMVLSDERVELPQAIAIDVGVIHGRG